MYHYFWCRGGLRGFNGVMLTEEALILLATLGASGLLVLGVAELAWPTKPRTQPRRTRPTVQCARRIALLAVASGLPTTLGTTQRVRDGAGGGGGGGGARPTPKAPCMIDACGSHWNVYTLLVVNVTVHVTVPTNSMSVDMFTPGPCRWKLWNRERSRTWIV